MKKLFAKSLVVTCAALGALLFCLPACKVGEAEVRYKLSEDGTHYIVDGVMGDKRGLSKYEIPSTYAGEDGVELPVTEIGDEAFWECYRLTSVTIPEGVTYIGDRAFAKTALKQCTIPDTVETIGYAAFGKCDNLKEITVPASVTELGDLAFYCCSGLVTARVEASVELLGDKVFWNPVATQGSNTFYSSSLTTVYLSKTIRTVNVSSLQGNMLTDIYYMGTEEEWTNVVFFAMVEVETASGETTLVEEKQDKTELLKNIKMHFSSKQN